MSDPETECARLIIKYTLALDAGDAAEVAALFTADGVWHRQGKDISGYEAIKKTILERESGVVIRHHISNIDIAVMAPDSATGRSYYALYRAETATGERPFPVEGPERCGDNFYSFKCIDNRWFLSRTEARPVFRRK